MLTFISVIIPVRANSPTCYYVVRNFPTNLCTRRFFVYFRKRFLIIIVLRKSCAYYYVRHETSRGANTTRLYGEYNNVIVTYDKKDTNGIITIAPSFSFCVHTEAVPSME